MFRVKFVFFVLLNLPALAAPEEVPYLINNSLSKIQFSSQLIEYIHTPSADNYVLTLFMIGEKLNQSNKVLESIPFYVRAQNIIISENLNQRFLNSIIHTRLGDIYYSCANYEKAAYHFDKWHQHLYKSSDQVFSNYNTYALSLQHTGNNEKANYFFDVALFYAHHLKRIDWIGLINGNRAVNHLYMGNYDEAKEAFIKDYLISRHFNNISSQYYALELLMEVYALQNNWKPFKKIELELNELAKRDSTLTRRNYYKIKSQYHEQRNEIDEASKAEATYQKMLIEDAYIRTALKSEILKLNIEEIEVKYKNESQKSKSRIQKSENYSVFVTIIFLSILFIAAYYAYKARKKAKLLAKANDARRKLVDNELLAYSQKISTLEKEILEKNRAVESMSIILKSNQADRTTTNNLESDSFVAALDSIKILRDEDWQTFKQLFSQVYPRFLTALTLLNPEISEAEKRLACLIRLNYTQQRIATTLGISHESVRKTNLRLRKRMKITTQEELIEFIFTVETH